MRKIVAIALALLMLTLCACGSKASPEKTIRRFETALQSMDIDGMINCVEPRSAKGLRSAANIAVGLLGLDIEDILNVVYLLVDVSKHVDAQGAASLKTAKLNVLSTSYNEDKSRAVVEIEFSYGGDSSTGTLNMIKTEGDWYIQLL